MQKLLREWLEEEQTDVTIILNTKALDECLWWRDLTLTKAGEEKFEAILNTPCTYLDNEEALEIYSSACTILTQDEFKAQMELFLNACAGYISAEEFSLWFE